MALLTKLQSWANEVADDVAADLTDHHFKFSATAEFLRAYAAQKGIEFDALRAGWQSAQAGHFKAIFVEAAGRDPFGIGYFSALLSVGALHNKINLPLKWYLGSYPSFLDAVRRQLRANPPKLERETIARRGWLRRGETGPSQDLLSEAERASSIA